MPHVKCKICNIVFYAKPSHIKIGYGKYCSSKCQYQGLRTGKTLRCFTCGKEIYRSIAKLSYSKSKKYFCSKSCQTTWRNRQFVGPKHANWKNGKMAYRSVLDRHKIRKICKLCGTRDARILATHHVDENHYNNELKNLTWLCHNCHYLVHHDIVEKQKLLSK